LDSCNEFHRIPIQGWMVVLELAMLKLPKRGQQQAMCAYTRLCHGCKIRFGNIFVTRIWLQWDL